VQKITVSIPHSSFDETAHLTSPECVLNFPLTSNNTPGVSFTLQNGIRTAAFVSFASKLFGSDFEDARDRAIRIAFSELRVNGDVKEINEGMLVSVLNVISPSVQRHNDICQRESNMQGIHGPKPHKQSDRGRRSTRLSAQYQQYASKTGYTRPLELFFYFLFFYFFWISFTTPRSPMLIRRRYNASGRGETRNL